MKNKNKNKIPEWYQKKRLAIDEAMLLGKPKNDLAKTKFSPCGMFYVETIPYHISPNGWDYSENRVYREDGKLVYKFNRNYAFGPFIWATNHSLGKFLLTGEDYQCMSVLNLETGEFQTFVPEEAKNGHAFCLADGSISPDGTRAALCGCEWGGPYYYKFVDFSDPMAFPYTEFGYVESFETPASKENTRGPGSTIVYDQPDMIVCWDGNNESVLMSTEPVEVWAETKEPTSVQSSIDFAKTGDLKSFFAKRNAPGAVQERVKFFNVNLDGSYTLVSMEFKEINITEEDSE